MAECKPLDIEEERRKLIDALIHPEDYGLQGCQTFAALEKFWLDNHAAPDSKCIIEDPRDWVIAVLGGFEPPEAKPDE